MGTSFTGPIIGFVGALFDVRVAFQNIWVTDDLAAVAMWDSPGTTDAAPVHAESVWARYRAIAGEEAFERLRHYTDAGNGRGEERPL